MLTEIKAGTTPALERDAVDMLLACHQRIRNFTGIAARLAEVEGAGAQEVANAAEAVHRYYSVALPLHEADENESVYPRLRANLSDAGERESLQAMVDQHGPIDEVVAKLIPRWAELKQNPEKIADFTGELRAYAERLQELWKEHLALEEEIVFPLIRSRLSQKDLDEIHAEMKQRRGIE